MSYIEQFTFNDFQENTYLIYDDTREAVVIDPGCYTKSEKIELKNKISSLGLNLTHLILTHAHIDHVFGNAFIYKEYDLKPKVHKDELQMLQLQPMIANQYGLEFEQGPDPDTFLQEGETFTFGDTSFDMLFTPGHSPASLSFYCAADSYIIGGDVLFKGSIGRTDLPGGNMDILLNSVRSQFFTLPDDTIVYSGHGSTTTIGDEKSSNPFFQ